MTKIMKALSDETRLSIVNLLRVESLCVCEIEAVLQNSQSNVSRHLAKLREAEIIISDKRAQWVYYEINQELLAAQPFLKTLVEVDLANNPRYQAEIAKLRQYRETNGVCQPLP
ncbi:metalloregulator ArsR/SmtB family transcription factor [Azotosporobacter soli]|uniref:ArsR/SmtB family transcription factor n=1 Tax=Azotosporobacter soli TaxID=3055040 RepID=UPI0031FF2878